MAVRKKAITLIPMDHEALVRRYLLGGFAVDRYQQFPRELISLTDDFNGMTGRNDSPQDILHYMRNMRKNGKWVTFDGAHRRLAQLGVDFLTDREWQILIDRYVARNQGSDQYGHDQKLAKELERDFAAITGRRVPGLLLATALMELRKDGKLPKLRKEEFGDLDKLPS